MVLAGPDSILPRQGPALARQGIKYLCTGTGQGGFTSQAAGMEGVAHSCRRVGSYPARGAGFRGQPGCQEAIPPVRCVCGSSWCRTRLKSRREYSCSIPGAIIGPGRYLPETSGCSADHLLNDAGKYEGFRLVSGNGAGCQNGWGE